MYPCWCAFPLCSCWQSYLLSYQRQAFGVCPSVSLRYPPHGKTSMPLLLRGSQEKEQRIFHPFWYSLKMGIEKGRPSEQSPKMKGIFYEAMQEKKLSESPKPLILLFFQKVLYRHSHQISCLICLPDKSGNFNTYSQKLFNKSIESKKKRPQSSKTGCCEASFSCF